MPRRFNFFIISLTAILTLAFCRAAAAGDMQPSASSPRAFKASSSVSLKSRKGSAKLGKRIKAEDRVLAAELHKLVDSSHPRPGKDFIAVSAVKGKIVPPPKAPSLKWNWRSVGDFFSLRSVRAPVAAPLPGVSRFPAGLPVWRGKVILCIVLLCLFWIA